MRVFETLEETILEVRRDLAKAPAVQSSRVQQNVGMNIPGRELLGYGYMTRLFPETREEFIDLAAKHFPFWAEYRAQLDEWVRQELVARCVPDYGLRRNEPTETLHPLLKSAIEGNWPSYTYSERLEGMIDAMARSLGKSPDSRRSFWPIFRREDAIRAHEPTRVPCSLGYEFIIRNIEGCPTMHTFYLQRSADFDIFWVTDLWFASRMGDQLVHNLRNHIPGLRNGPVYHFIVSLHSFEVDRHEIY